MKTIRPLIALLALALCRTAAAQEYGQWSWNATLDGAYRANRFESSGETVTDSRQNDFGLSIGVDGFFIHPAIAAFSASVKEGMTRHPTESATDTDLRGYSFRLSVLPESFFPIQLWASRQDYSYQPQSDAGEFLYSVPDSGTNYGGRVRLRGGPLSGLEANVERSSTDFSGVTEDRATFDRDSLNWNRGTSRLQQHYRLDHQRQTFVQSDTQLDDLLGVVEGQGTVGRWRWNSFANALRREIGTDSANGPAFQVARLSSSASGIDTDRPGWSFGADSSLAGTDGVDSSSHQLTARYTRPAARGLRWASSVSYAIQSADDQRLQAPAVGLTAVWSASPRNFAVILSSGVGVTRLSSSGSRALPTQNRFQYSGQASIGRAWSDRLNSRLEFGFAQDQLSVSSMVEGEPGFGLVGAPGTEDASHARFELGGRTARLGFSAYSDWSARKSSRESMEHYRVDTFVHTLQVTSPRLSASIATGNSDATTTQFQTIRFRSATLSANIASFLSLSGIYRRDRREAVFEPFVDGERLDAVATIRVGAFYLDPRAFWVESRWVDGREEKNRGFMMSISRQFGGYLPIVSAPKRRGTIQ